MNSKSKVSRNLLLGISSEILTIILGILVPRFVLTSYGSEINGLISSVTQVYSYIALLEAGIGMATVQALYKNVGSEYNKEKINAILAATNKYYHRSGFFFIIAIVMFSFIYPLVIKTDIPIIIVIWVIILNGFGSVINFFYQGKYFLLLEAEGKNYVRTSLNMATNVFKNTAKIFLMANGYSVVFVQAIALIVSLIQMIYITCYIKRNYTWINLKVKPDYKSISQRKNVFVHQITGMIFYNTDVITLSLFCGLQIVSVYSMYTMLFSMIGTALNTVYTSVAFTMGQTFHTDRHRFMKIYDAYELLFMTLVFALYSVANYFILPFMRLYTSGVTDINYIDKRLPLLFIATYLLSCGRSAPNHVINIAGHFKNTQNRAIIEAIINITVSVIACQKYGIYGVLFGTIAAMLYRANDIIIYACKHILNISPWVTYKRWGINVSVFGLLLITNSFIHLPLNSYVDIVIWCIPYTLFTILLFFSIVCVFERKTTKFIYELFIDKVKKKKM